MCSPDTSVKVRSKESLDVHMLALSERCNQIRTHKGKTSGTTTYKRTRRGSCQKVYIHHQSRTSRYYWTLKLLLDVFTGALLPYILSFMFLVRVPWVVLLN